MDSTIYFSCGLDRCSKRMPVEAVISTNCGARKVEAGAAAFWAAAGNGTRGESDTREESTKPRAAPRNTRHNRPCFTEDVPFTLPLHLRTHLQLPSPNPLPS